MSMADYWIGYMSTTEYTLLPNDDSQMERPTNILVGVQCIENGEYPCLESGTYDKKWLRVGRSEMELCRKNVKRQ